VIREKNDAVRCIFGAIFSEENIREIVGYSDHAKALLVDGYYDEYSVVKELVAGADETFVVSVIETKKPKYKLYYAGKPWDTILSTETGSDFRETVYQKLKTLFGKQIYTSTIIIPKEGKYW
jgi:hypothetical protein